MENPGWNSRQSALFLPAEKKPWTRNSRSIAFGEPENNGEFSGTHIFWGFLEEPFGLEYSKAQAAVNRLCIKRGFTAERPNGIHHAWQWPVSLQETGSGTVPGCKAF